MNVKFISYCFHPSFRFPGPRSRTPKWATYEHHVKQMWKNDVILHFRMTFIPISHYFHMSSTSHSFHISLICFWHLPSEGCGWPWNIEDKMNSNLTGISLINHLEQSYKSTNNRHTLAWFHANRLMNNIWHLNTVKVRPGEHRLSLAVQHCWADLVEVYPDLKSWRIWTRQVIRLIWLVIGWAPGGRAHLLSSLYQEWSMLSEHWELRSLWLHRWPGHLGNISLSLSLSLYLSVCPSLRLCQSLSI